MSNPPVQPPPSDGSEPGQESTPAPQTPPAYGQNAPQAPQYGQQTPPAYGQNAPEAPQYGQQTPPAYGQNAPQAPQYGQQTPPAYGQNAPQAPQYGQQTPPAYGQNAPQAPQYGQSPYGQSPYAQYPSEQPQAQGAVPQLVNTSFWLIIAAGALWVISMLVSLGTLDSPAVRDMFEQQMAASGTSIDFESIKGVLIGTIVVFAAISAGLYALVAFNVRKGKNWARILGTVFAALSVFNIIPLSLATLAALVGIAAIVLLYLPAAAPYFQKRQPFANPYGQPGAPFGK
ncbi:Yip1 family protein [Arthrobacter sp. 131MFCol6.1]|uniref:Yip1 family protein n=1 Tax=Arthrobacter sp. 131MFCol6.1 TaxID=1157944 RepID=UPI0003811598|nr:Yip1 family protein [Arthrobacter sp. 131MFCol6.1]